VSSHDNSWQKAKLKAQRRDLTGEREGCGSWRFAANDPNWPEAVLKADGITSDAGFDKSFRLSFRLSFRQSGR